MNKLWGRLTLAFGLVVMSGVMIAALLANYQLDIQFRRFVMHDQMQLALTPRLTDYYVSQRSWRGVEALLDNQTGFGMMARGRGLGRGGPALALFDATGQLVFDGSDDNRPLQLDEQTRTKATSLEWQGETIGYLLISSGVGQNELSGAAQTFLDQINRALVQAGLIAGGLGLLIGLIIARGVSAPLGQLATAVRQISRGHLNQRVPVKGTEELIDLANAFNEMTAHLQEAETLRRNLMADVAHELRTPLSIIQGNLQAILDGVYPLETSEIASIYEETLILKRLINDLREVAQAEAGQLNLNIQSIALGPLLTETINLFQEVARENNIELTLTSPKHAPPVAIDPDRTRQVLHNLLANALRHTPEGGQVGIESEVFTPQNSSSAFIRVSVSDTGPGLAGSELPYVFDRFWRADKSRSREQGGSGLGLAIARQLVEAQGGQIGVKSEGKPGRGSQFWFTTPVADPEIVA